MVETKELSTGIHWVEKYRPKNLDDLVSHQNIISILEKFIQGDHLPHLLFHGPPGTGKTSTILACARKLYKEKDIGSMVVELNASDDRGIGIVRDKILSFASSKIMFSQYSFKLIILDEADAMTQDAQNALRRKKYTSNVRFCFICNYLNKIIPAIQSRCTKFRFARLTPTQIKSRLDYICGQEKINITEDGKNALMELSEGDMRKVLNVLQTSAAAFGIVNEANVYKCCGLPCKDEIQKILEWLLNEKFSVIYENMTEMMLNNGYSLLDILKGLHSQLLKIDFPRHIKLDIFVKLADIEVNCCAGSSEKVQLSGLISIFQEARYLNQNETNMED